MVQIVLLYVGAVLFCNGIWLLGKIDDDEIRIMNILTGLTNVIIAIIAIIISQIKGDPELLAFSAQILLFAFTYLWVAFNNHTKADGRGLGWFCLFVALTAAPTAAITLHGSEGSTWLVWLGFNWAAWAVLWFLYWGLLAAQWPIQKLTGYVTLVEGIITGWLPAYLIMMGFMSLPS